MGKPEGFTSRIRVLMIIFNQIVFYPSDFHKLDTQLHDS